MALAFLSEQPRGEPAVEVEGFAQLVPIVFEGLHQFLIGVKGTAALLLLVASFLALRLLLAYLGQFFLEFVDLSDQLSVLPQQFLVDPVDLA
jgi:TM2 domain-containing membrane protein YozV